MLNFVINTPAENGNENANKCNESPPSTFDDSDADPNYTLDNRNEESDSSSINTQNTPSSSISFPRSGEKGQPTRKRKRNVDMWKKNIKKRLRECGMTYEGQGGKVHRSRRVQESTCEKTCFLECGRMISEKQRKIIHKKFWSLNDAEKGQFYSKFVVKVPTERKRSANQNYSRRKFSYKYFLETNQRRYRVCQRFFLLTLDVSKNRIYYFFKKHYDQETGTSIPPRKGKYVKRRTPDEKTLEVKNHIQSFPCIDSHYCRANSQKQYLEAGLNLSKMYKLYVERSSSPVKKNIYDKVFNEEFNLSFHKPKKDLCDCCAAYRNMSNPTNDDVKNN